MKTAEKTPIDPTHALEALRETMRSNLELSTQQKDAVKNDPMTQSYHAGCEYAYRMAILYIDLEIKLTKSTNNTPDK